MGFSLFNSVAIAAKHAIEKLGLQRYVVRDYKRGMQAIIMVCKRLQIVCKRLQRRYVRDYKRGMHIGVQEITEEITKVCVQCLL